ncbi:MAG: cytochrome c [Sediminimonas qiaohouensis]|uniref:Cytochrome c n=1 Tax=Sediminimonas qiaohouensis TaxID=552061 RepID=A0A7C9L8D1_9RHOB|nr:cytochrome c [Sediminimonas qiaohouensis]MTJ05175.1 cytochrome c [Sediminimonas qiaohouensis]
MNKLGWIIGAVLLAGLGVFLWEMSRPATQTQAARATTGGSATIPVIRPGGDSMTPPDTSAIPDGAPIVAVNLPSKLSDEAKMGKRAFEATCAKCHGENAAGQNGIAPPLVWSTYRPAHHGDAAFQRAAMQGVRAHHWNFGNMPPVKGLTRADVKYITRYVRELQRTNGVQ